ncbi:hypothetical protein EMIHUDRAFT_426412 [Emiliania huxleyi CCMP1516]|uniref:Uncharacterized protein n=2 Tax=Emiliania huxleyi TaxID=2903 RepID=A0A0D3KR67_EMIH1|nr:hypothetical protein EMIHUDRAFT_426412 [Emiliania huxleyi CCMP1516]EOD38252.1 hypothetical protein EMIHUDRAFT_426412 [Emiliania huxleyi CCMP1516]|eukprot:XP_005790681.1 hypothetical protein EMIHUDRAFT_426412 [Emiliania huxleyi CCMP1516]
MCLPDACCGPAVLYVGFNQDNGCFACGTDSGFRIFNCDPFRQTYRRDFTNGGIGIVEMLFRCNILALVGGGRNPRYPPNKVMIWDDHQNRCIGEPCLLSFRSEVKAVRMSRERVVVVLEYRIYVYNFAGGRPYLGCTSAIPHLGYTSVHIFADLNLLHTIETISNPRGLCSLCADSRACVIACCGLQKGHVRAELFDITRTTLISAHEASLSCIALSSYAMRHHTLWCTLVRVWDTRSGQRLMELRRGAEPAAIQCMNFHADSSWLLVGSDHGTIHVFKLQEGDADQAPELTPPVPATTLAYPSDTPDNPRSSLSFLGSLLPKSLVPTYIQSQWSFAQFRMPGSERALTRTICAFAPENTNSFLVVSADGTFYKCGFDPIRGGECYREDWQRFLMPEDDE